MKCPKCGYLGYERVERCRNCGYEFSLTSSAASAAAGPELRLRDSGQNPQPLDDLELLDGAEQVDVDRFAVRPGRTPSGRSPSEELANGFGELPLFGEPTVDDDVPLITRPSAPRVPLSVRRATPEVPRLRAESRAPLLDWAEPSVSTASSRPTPERVQLPAARSARPMPVETSIDADDANEPASISSRATAAAIDIALLALVDLVVVYFTMKICRLSLSEVVLLPRGPLLAFLALQNGGYFVAFTTTGQTLGKMLAGVRVLADDSDSTPDIGRSLIRAACWMVLALPAGLGLFSAGLSKDGRGLHDRFAGTRVVRAGA